jgi:2-oxoglutarate dehydrogenase E2 component (dihydrolipoamide succinyltransferase)
MPTKVLVPQLGEAIEEVTIIKWLKAEGDTVEEFDGLLEVETDKVVAEVPSPAAGTVLSIVIPTEGEVVSVGTVLAWIGQHGEEVPQDGSVPRDETPTVPMPTKEKAEVAEQPPLITEKEMDQSVKVGRHPDLGFISPVVARIASEHHIDISKVKGSGMGGRITKKDVLAYVDGQGAPAKAPVPPSPKFAAPMPGEVIPHTVIRRRIAEHMVMSKRESPHVTTVMEADFSQVIAHRAANKEAFHRDGVRLTFTAYFVSATMEALKTFPLVNSSWSDDGIVLHREINIGMATDLGDEGLIVPVIKGVDQLSLLGIARTVNDLAERARSKKLNPGEVQNGTFSITNHGVSGSLFAAPIINQPQCAILGVGAIQKRVIVVTDEAGNDAMSIRPMVYLSLTFDHRILDGAIADHFLAKIVETLENWPEA